MKPGFNQHPDDLDHLPSWPPLELRRAPGPRLERAPQHEAYELALGLWTIVALLGVAFGLGVAKYAQAWARDLFHPAAVWGGVVVLVSLAVVVVAATRYQLRGAGLPIAAYASRTLSLLSVLLVLALAWAALSMIWVAG
jgi:hypothetical protein